MYSKNWPSLGRIHYKFKAPCLYSAQCCTTGDQERLCYDPEASSRGEVGCSLVYKIGTIAPGVLKVGK